ncbi:hypothetical protein [Desulforegula conservatrix]|uniref:hypothetical protein n=1 Tax=Desulforegula conservatrix TaxID=153026 RepID=UPI00042538CE|nr:hypothetical protein [Desulforegula conservatrix]
MQTIKKKYPGRPSLLIITCVLFFSIVTAQAASPGDYDQKIKALAEECRAEVITQFELLVSSGKLTTGQLFDTFYIPIPDTSPQKYHTQYDALCDQVIQRIIDDYLNKDPKIIYVISVDRNGYVPTHNSKFNQPLTGNPEVDAAKNRTKRLFNDRTGLEAARNKEAVLVQQYSQDTGENIIDVSVPVFIHKQHWGAIRIGYQP